jgi:hypothetical protein
VNGLSEKQLVDRLDQLTADAVERRLPATSSVAAYLSGGGGHSRFDGGGFGLTYRF